MTATTADRASARAENRGGVSSNRRDRSCDRGTPARTSAASLLGFLRAQFIERPRILRLDGLGCAGDDDDRAVGLDLVAGDRDRGLARLLGHALKRGLARLGRLG